MTPNESSDDIRSKDLGKNFKDLIANAFGSVHWDSLMDHIQETCPPGVDPAEEVAKRLELDPDTPLRWFKRANYPHPNKFFLVLVALKVAIKDVHFPEYCDVIYNAVARTIERLRTHHCRRTPDRRITHEHFECVRLLLDQPDSRVLFIKNPKNKNAHRRAVEQVLSNVLGQMTNLFPRCAAWSLDDVSQVSEEWLDAYALYEHNRPGAWSFLNEVRYRE
jgi:hypothetical protein